MYPLRLASFGLMLILPIALYFAALSGSVILIWLLLALFAAANTLLVAMR